MQAFVIQELAEEAKPVAPPGPRRRQWGWRIGALAVGYPTDALSRNAPGDIGLDHETRRAGENIHLAQMLLHPHPSHQELLGRAIGKTLMAADLARMGAQRAIGPSHHMAVGGADGEKFVEGE